MVNKAITFDLEGGDIKVPVVGQFELQLPPYFATETKKGWKLLNPITTIRNLAKRNKELVLDLVRSPSSLQPEIGEEEGIDMPSIEDFNPADQKKLRRWEANQNKEGKYPKTDKPVKPRGRPAFLPKNARLQGLTYKKGTTHYGDNLNKKKKSGSEEGEQPPPPPPSPPQSESESSSSESEEEEEKRPRGRPKTKATLEKERRLAEEKAEAERRKKAQEDRKTREEKERAEEDIRRKDYENSKKETTSMGGEDKRSSWKKRLAEYTKSFDSETQFQIRRLEEKNDSSKYNGQIAYLRDILQAQKPRWEKEKAEAEAELQGLIKKVKEDPKNQFDDKGRWIIQGEYRDGYGRTAKATYHLDLNTGKYTNKSKKDNGDIENIQAGRRGQIGIYKSGVATGNKYFEPAIDPKDFPKPFVSNTDDRGSVEVPSFTPYRGLAYQIQQVWKKIMDSKWSLETPPLFIPIYERMKEEKKAKLNKEIEDLKKERNEELEEWIRKNRPSGSGLTGGLNPTRYNEEDDSDEEGGSEYDDGRDGTGSGGSIFSGLLSKVKSLVINPVEAVVNKVSDIGHKVIHGRMDYPPSAKAIIDKYADQQVQGVSLHRLVLPSIYTKILSVWTKGETERRLKEEPKDKLFHISMWVTLPNAVILCEKNEVIHLQVNPKRAKEEEEQPAPTPSNTTFRELLEKGRARVGDEKFFSYSAKSNNCGNWIEDILRANGIETQATRNFIGQDAHKILHGFPALRKTLNTLTDIAGRANVILEGGKLPDYPDWENMKWGSFTKQFERYNEEHPDNEIEDLEHFAKSILANPKEYQPRTLKRARFYLNVILKKKSHSNNIMPSHRMNGGAVSIPLSNAVMRPAVWTGAGYENGNLIGADPRVRSPMPIHAHHPNAVDTIFHDPNHPSAGGGIHHHHHYHIDGMGFFDFLDPNKNGVAQALDPNRNGLADAFKAGGSAENFGKQVASTLIHKGLPVVGQVAGNALGDLLMPETGGLGGMALGQAGKAGGNALGDLIGKETGYGLKKPKRFVKGSKEAKEFMASIRKKRSKRIYGGNIPEPPSRSPITNPSLLK